MDGDTNSRDGCPRCGKSTRVSVPRCPHCGHRAHRSAPAGEAATDAPADGKGGFRRFVLTDLQKQVLVASVARRGRAAPIYLQPPTTAGPGEVKSGSQRLYGNAAVVAVVRLIEPGLVTKTGRDCFELTAHGVQVAEAMLNPLRRRSAEIWVPAESPAPSPRLGGPLPR